MAQQNETQKFGEIWELVKNSFLETLSESTVELWFGEIEILSFQDDMICLGIPAEWKFKIVNEKYIGEIKKKFHNLLGFEVDVRLTFTGSATAADRLQTILRTEKKESDHRDSGERALPSYNFEYTFENFIVGSTNKFAHAACMAVANNVTQYNPLFIYGHSGLGKTHLLYATINRMKQNNPNIKIIYTKGEDFTNQMISCLANKTIEDFRDKYRKCDVLLIDDIQFIAGKDATQEEFFHTFNALYEEKKQIILASDRPPRDLKTLEDRLKSRFEWGLLADIEPPDLELRIAIIKKKAEQVNITIPNDVLTFLGENLRSNIRQIEGAIKKLGALTFLEGKEITMELAHECLSELLGGAEPIKVTVDKIFSAVYHKYGISKEDLTSSKRNKEIAAARHVCIFLIREITEMSYPNIAKIFERDHSTIISSYNMTFARYQMDALFTIEMDDLKKEISGQA